MQSGLILSNISYVLEITLPIDSPKFFPLTSRKKSGFLISRSSKKFDLIHNRNFVQYELFYAQKMNHIF